MNLVEEREIGLRDWPAPPSKHSAFYHKINSFMTIPDIFEQVRLMIHDHKYLWEYREYPDELLDLLATIDRLEDK